MKPRLVYVDHKQLAYEREMERERLRYIAEGRCYECDRIVIDAGGVLAGMLICMECAEREIANIEEALAKIDESERQREVR